MNKRLGPLLAPVKPLINEEGADLSAPSSFYARKVSSDRSGRANPLGSFQYLEQSQVFFVAFAAHVQVVTDKRFQVGNIFPALVGLSVFIYQCKNFIAGKFFLVSVLQSAHEVLYCFFGEFRIAAQSSNNFVEELLHIHKGHCFDVRVRSFLTLAQKLQGLPVHPTLRFAGVVSIASEHHVKVCRGRCGWFLAVLRLLPWAYPASLT